MARKKTCLIIKDFIDIFLNLQVFNDPKMPSLAFRFNQPSLEIDPKVFKHRLQRNKSLHSCHNLYEESRRPHQPWSVSPKFVTVAAAKCSLPLEFKATVATLPPISANRQSLAVDSGFFRLRRSKSHSDALKAWNILICDEILMMLLNKPAVDWLAIKIL